MPRPPSGKRERLSAAAAELVASHGLEGATIAAIAQRAQVPPGSVYYYLATKADIADAAVASWGSARASALAQWSGAGDARERLVAYLDAAVADAPRTLEFGTIGTLAGQLRAHAPAAADAAAGVIRETVDWAAGNFKELGFAPEAAAARALHLVTGIEGAGQLAHALNDRTPIDREGAHLSRWVANSRSSA
jgi:AcrR family transcriptional regulator